MYLQTLTLTNFRNYEYLKLNLNQNINVFYGENGAGKTNLLEAIFVMSTGRSHRTPRDRDMVMKYRQQAYINLGAVKKEGSIEASMMLPIKGSKRIKINGHYIKRMAELMGVITAIMFSPEDLKLVKEGPEERRRFIDICLSQIKPGYFINLQRYYKILEQRNEMLKSLKYSGAQNNMLGIWNEQMSLVGTAVISDRLWFLDKLHAKVHDVHRYLTGDKERISLKYRSTVNIKDDIEVNFKTSLDKVINWDIKMGTTSVGPHRDDMEIYIDGMDMRYYGSQGQQRTAALSIKLGQLAVAEELIGETPILLLDDVMSELDKSRRSMLLKYIHGYQTFLTCTERPDYFENMVGKASFLVKDGTARLDGYGDLNT